MKSKILLLATTILMATNFVAYAQAPEKFNYQGIARDNTGAALANQSLGVKISILHNTTVDYSETHTVTTNDFGLYTLVIGDGTPTFGGIALIDWNSGNKFIKVEIDPNGGTNYTDLGSTELLSVPYALYAMDSGGGNYTAGSGITISGNSISADLGNDIATAELQNNAVTSGKIDNGAVATADLANNAVTSAKIANAAITAPKLGQMGAANDEVLKWNGTAWAPATDAQGTPGSTYTAGNGITISGSNAISADLGTDIATAELQNNAVTSGKIDNGAVATADLANNAVTAAKIDAMGATNGQVLKFNGTDWAPANDDPGAAGWGLGGNVAGPGDFIGTTNNEPLRFRQNNFSVGFIDGEITAFGHNTLGSNTTGTFNVAIGNQALSSNTTGNTNTAFGYNALSANTTAHSNSAFGSHALNSNTTGHYNNAFGQAALSQNTTGIQNAAFGHGTLNANTTGNYNIAFGNNSLANSTTGDKNSAYGQNALFANTTGSHNTSSGYSALESNTTGDHNTGIGNEADVASGGLTNATAIGAYAEVAQSNSLVLGSINGVNGASASVKVGIGTSTPNALLAIEGDVSPSGIPYGLNINLNSIASNQDMLQLKAPTTSSGYQFIEASVGFDNVFILQADGSIETKGDVVFDNGNPGESWTMTNNDIGIASLEFHYNSSLTSWISPSGNYNTSDRRLKENIEPAISVLDRVNAIKIMRYNYKKDESKKETIGYIAQELKEQFPEFVQLSGENDEGISYYGVNYAGMSAVAIKAIQEQQKMMQEKEQRIQQLETKLQKQENLLLELKKRVEDLEND